ncbi:hypothetical protein C5167_004143 [Papaver somniferum]|nr:hypothetical protein C5167_004143 [Papaver somniferum]
MAWYNTEPKPCQGQIWMHGGMAPLPKCLLQQSKEEEEEEEEQIESKANFVYSGLEDAYLTLDGAAQVADNGLLILTNQNNSININGLKSVQAESAKYCTDKTDGKAIQVWVKYDGPQQQLTVTTAPVKVHKPEVPSLSLSQDLSAIFLVSMYVGFSSSTQTHPELPEPKEKAMMLTMMLAIMSIIVPTFVFITVCLGFFFFLRAESSLSW